MAANNFKSDESFLQKLAVGAAGTKATMARLEEMGFRPIELERGSSGFKIWKRIKIKRVRVPDILCLTTGIRFESRGKTKLEISMSHSRADPNRAWDTGLSSNDYVAFVMFESRDGSIVDWEAVSPVHFIKVKDMQDAYKKKRVKITTPKGVEEGSEIRVIWPATRAQEASRVAEVTDTIIRLEPLSGGPARRCMLGRKTTALTPLCKAGDIVKKNQLVAAVTPISLKLSPIPDVGESYFREKLSSPVLSERYAAAKALRYRGYETSTTVLVGRVVHEAEDIYVRLEAAAALANQDNAVGWEFLEGSLSSPFNQVQLETVIVLSEIPKSRSQKLLIDVLGDRHKHEEIRAGAAWALGEFRNTDASRALVSVFDEASMEVKTEAARALSRIAPDQIPLLVELLQESDWAKRDGLAWVLARHGNFELKTILDKKPDENLRRWLSYILGYGKDRFLEEAIREVCNADPEVYFSATVLWQILASWVHELEEY